MPQVTALLASMGLPLPQREALLTGTEGVLILLDHYGLVIRLERLHAIWNGDRIDNNPHILQPLLQRRLTKNVVMEICPGTKTTTDTAYPFDLKKALERAGIDFWDDQTGNVGILPGADVPVVIDRLAAKHMEGRVAKLRRTLAAKKENPQADLYRDLRAAAARAWPAKVSKPDAAAMQQFMALCLRKKAEGVLVAGWQERDPAVKVYPASKADMATLAGRAYAVQIQQSR